MNEPLRYLSTRGRSPAVTISGAIAAGLAPDGGLYVPQTFPRLDASSFDPDGSLADTAATLLAPFFAGDPLAAELPAICREALDFETPLRPLPQRDTFVLELFHGPTAAFKDVGARFLAACLRRLPRDDARPLTILVATSGDTGAAVGAAFHGQPNIDVVILYPDGRVSPRQAHQLGSFGGNVRTLRVQGRFDDCQRMVKAALNDAALQVVRPLSSANSISLGRLLPQMSYYAHAALQLWREHGVPLNFVVPTGNLGNAVAALWARRLGLPVGEVRLACNANVTLPEFFGGGDYRPRDAVATLANAMDVGAPATSNACAGPSATTTLHCARKSPQPASTTPAFATPSHTMRMRTERCSVRTARRRCMCWTPCAQPAIQRPGRSSRPPIRPSSKAWSNPWSVTPSPCPRCSPRCWIERRKLNRWPPRIEP